MRPAVGTKIGATPIDGEHKKGKAKHFTHWLSPPKSLEDNFHDGLCLPRTLLRAKGLGKNETACSQEGLEELTTRVVTRVLCSMKSTIADLLQATTAGSVANANPT